MASIRGTTPKPKGKQAPLPVRAAPSRPWLGHQTKTTGTGLGGYAANMTKDLRDITVGLAAIPFMAGEALGADISGHGEPGGSLANLGKEMAHGFTETSPLASMVKGDWSETGRRLYQYPVSGALDLTGTAGVISGGPRRLARAAAVRNIGGDQAKLMKFAGHRAKGPARDPQISPDGIDTGLEVPKDRTESGFRYDREGINVGGTLWAKPSHRRVMPSRDADSILDETSMDALIKEVDIGQDFSKAEYDSWSRRSKNETFATIGDKVWSARRSIPGRMPFSTNKKINRDYRKKRQKFARVDKQMIEQPFKQIEGLWNKAVLPALSHIEDKKTRQKIADEAFVMANDGITTVGQMIEYLQNAVPASHARKARHSEKVQEIQVKLAALQGKSDQLNTIEHEARQQVEAGALQRSTLNNIMGDFVDHWTEINDLDRERRRLNDEIGAINHFQKMNELFEKTGESPQGDPLRYNITQQNFYSKYTRELDDLLSSDEIEGVLDRMEELNEMTEEHAIANFDGQLTQDALVNNRFRTAEVYDLEGVSDQSKAKLQRQRKYQVDTLPDVRSPSFRSRAAGKGYAERKGGKYDTINDPDIMGRDVAPSQIGLPEDMELWHRATREPKVYRQKAWDEFKNFKVAQNRKAISDGAVWVTPTTMRMHMRDQPGLISMAPDDPKTPPQGTPLVAVAWGEGIGMEMMNLYTTAVDLADAFRQVGGDKVAYGLNKLAADALGRNELGIGDHSSAALKRHMRNVQNNKSVMLIPRDLYQSMAFNFGSDVGALTGAFKLIENIHQLWKPQVLHLRPKWHWYNAIGSAIILAMHEGIATAAMDLYKANRGMWGRENLTKSLGTDYKNVDTPQSLNRAISERFGDVLSVQGSSAQYDLSPLSGEKPLAWLSDKGPTGLFKDSYNKVVDKSAEINSKVFDNPPRRARIYNITMRRVKNVKRSAEENGVDMSQYSDLEIAKKLIEDWDTREAIAREALDDMIDFTDMTPAELRFSILMMPFWSWIKGSTKVFTAGYTTENPIRTGTWRYASREGSEYADEKMNAHLPSYMRGAVPSSDTKMGSALRMITGLDDPTMLLGGAMPQATAAEAWGLLPSAMQGFPRSGESPLGVVGPAPSAAVSIATGQHPFYRTPLPKGQSTATTAMQSFTPPWVKLAGNRFDEVKPNTTTERTFRGDLLGYMFPGTYVDVRRGPAAARAREEEKDLYYDDEFDWQSKEDWQKYLAGL